MSQFKRVVIKLGSQIIAGADGGVDPQLLSKLALRVQSLKRGGIDVVLVTSGAVALGRKTLGLKPPLTTPEKQACAAVGQGLLMSLYEESFGSAGLTVAQILVTDRDLSSRTGYLNLKQTFDTLLHFGVIPIVNENDSVSTLELAENAKSSFGDNDKLSAIVAAKLEADVLILVTNVDGIYTSNPVRNPKAVKLKTVTEVQELLKVDTEGQSDLGRGGMVTKLEAAQLASVCGVTTIVVDPQGLFSLDFSKFPAEHPGTLVQPHALLKGKKKWIGTSSGFRGVLQINEGARLALVEKGASLLCVGVTNFSGEFQSGEVLSIRGEEGQEIGRGIARLSSLELQTVLSLPKGSESPVLIHRDELAVLLGGES